jgi:small subunit ribosomal protein S1
MKRPAQEPDPDLDPARDDAGAFARALADFERGAAAAAAAPRSGAEVAVGDRVRGRVVSIGSEHALVDFGGRSEAAVETRHFREPDGTLRLTVGDALELFVIEAGEQVVLAPSLRADPHGALRQVREARAAGVPVSGRVTGLNAGGLDVDLGGVRGFCPISQVELHYCEDASAYVGRTLEFLVTSVGEGRAGAVLSRRKLLERAAAERAQELLASLTPGAELDGTVARIEPFGAFVDLGGIDGLVHVSEIRYERIGDPRDALRVGERVRVRVLRVETGKEGRPRIGLSIKAAAPDPWTGIEQRFVAGARARGVVARLTDFGAFVTLAPGIDGLVHISEVAERRLTHVRDALQVGQEVEALILAVEPARRRIALSIRGALEAAPSAAEPAAEPAVAPPPQATAPAEPTTMALALRKAMEEAAKRQGR